MATYKEIQAYIKSKYHIYVKTCWIADLKEEHGLPLRKAPNRISKDRVNPCPQNIKSKILDAFKYFNML